jgi:peptidyl-dipeptidase A
VAPVERGEAFFDPGAKYHIPGNTPYARYFLARVLQFQFHRALCEDRGLRRRRCTAARSTAARRPGDRLKAMLRWAPRRPWPDALEAITGERELDAGRGRLLRAAQGLARRAEPSMTIAESSGSNWKRISW